MTLPMNEIIKTVAVGYADNTYDRTSTVGHWAQILESMPLNTPMTASEIAEKATTDCHLAGGYWSFDYRNVIQLFKALAPYGIILRKEVACEPYEIQVETRRKYDYYSHNWVGGDVITKTINTKVYFSRVK